MYGGPTVHVGNSTVKVEDHPRIHTYRSKLDRWPCHVTVAEKKACFFVEFGPVTRHGYPSLRNLTD